ncbi:tRNA(Met) cytidine acetyltransferase TmcA [Paraglaciecola polaris]|uniref:tRNA(Met) cytidine acetyltransferase TmcA n=1 Tax=Paraglaciecola polaris TaxID=222814 RepID=UPI0030EF48D4
MDLNFKIQNWLKERLNRTCHRQLVVISGPQEWAEKETQAILTSINVTESKSLWVGDRIGSAQHIDCTAYRQHLGKEYAALAYNAYSGLNANALMAFSGSISSTGLMVLICPALEIWPTFRDPQVTNGSSFGIHQSNGPSHFILRLISLIQSDPNSIIITPQDFNGRNSYVALPELSRTLNETTPEQQRVIENIIQSTEGHRHRPVVLTADRGRGKSSALGLAAKVLIYRNNKRIIITAPHKKNVEQVFSFAQSDLLRTPGVDAGLRFVPPDVLLVDDYETDLLFIDEAAAVPSSILKALLEKYPRVVLSSTVHGYEGAGRGFELRFKPYLERNNKGWKALSLKTPIRWYREDCLEAFWFRCFMMQDAQPFRIERTTKNNTFNQPNRHSLDVGQIPRIEILTLSSHQLIEEPDLLKQTFSLLVNAHYQTSPDDLVRLLDAPEQRVFAYTHNSQVIGVALIIEEGGAQLGQLSKSIIQGDRRVKGHLVAQNLALHTAREEFCLTKQWRVVRIAVDQRQRRNGVASQLLSVIKDDAEARGIELLTSSFGASREILHFWFQNGFSPMKLGFKRDAASDEASLIVGKALSANALTLVTNTNGQFGEELNYHISRYHRMTDTAMLTQLLTQCHHESLTQDELQQIECFLASKNPFDTFARVLAKYLLAKLSSIKQSSEIPNDANLLVATLIQFKPIQVLIKEFALIGKKDLNQRIKLALLGL